MCPHSFFANGGKTSGGLWQALGNHPCLYNLQLPNVNLLNPFSYNVLKRLKLKQNVKKVTRGLITKRIGLPFVFSNKIYHPFNAKHLPLIISDS